MVSVADWEKMCNDGGKIYYWHNDNVQIVPANETAPAYRTGELMFAVNGLKMSCNDIFTNEADCARAHIKQVINDFKLEVK